MGSAGVRSAQSGAEDQPSLSMDTQSPPLLPFLPLSPSPSPVCFDLSEQRHLNVSVHAGKPTFCFHHILADVTEFCLTYSRFHSSVLPWGCNFLEQAVLTHAGLWLRQWHSGIHSSIYFTLCTSRVKEQVCFRLKGAAELLGGLCSVYI